MRTRCGRVVCVTQRKCACAVAPLLLFVVDNSSNAYNINNAKAGCTPFTINQCRALSSGRSDCSGRAHTNAHKFLYDHRGLITNRFQRAWRACVYVFVWPSHRKFVHNETFTRIRPPQRLVSFYLFFLFFWRERVRAHTSTIRDANEQNPHAVLHGRSRTRRAREWQMMGTICLGDDDDSISVENLCAWKGREGCAHVCWPYCSGLFVAVRGGEASVFCDGIIGCLWIGTVAVGELSVCVCVYVCVNVIIDLRIFERTNATKQTRR